MTPHVPPTNEEWEANNGVLYGSTQLRHNRPPSPSEGDPTATIAELERQLAASEAARVGERDAKDRAETRARGLTVAEEARVKAEADLATERRKSNLIECAYSAKLATSERERDELRQQRDELAATAARANEVILRFGRFLDLFSMPGKKDISEIYGAWGKLLDFYDGSADPAAILREHDERRDAEVVALSAGLRLAHEQMRLADMPSDEIERTMGLDACKRVLELHDAEAAKPLVEALTNLMGLFDTPAERLHRKQRRERIGAKDDGFYDEVIQSGRAALAPYRKDTL
jgi:hypothetical protein